MEQTQETFNVELAKQAQAEYCKENKMPHFAPSDGSCYRCRRQIYNEIPRLDPRYSSGISVERAGRGLITGCPHCNHTYCD